MSIRSKILRSLLLAFTLVMVCLPLQPRQTLPVVYGKVLLQTASGLKKPLTGAQIQLLERLGSPAEVKPGKVLFTTYTTSSGGFAFYGVKQGSYLLKVSLGEKIFRQWRDNKRCDTTPLEIKYPSVTKKLPDLIVVQ
jgi:hypothetical protein